MKLARGAHETLRVLLRAHDAPDADSWVSTTTTTSETYVGGRSAFALEDRGLVVVRLKSGWRMQAKLTDAGVAEARRHARCTTHVGRFRCAPAAG